MTTFDTKASDRSGLNPETNTPHRLRLGDVLGSIELSPGEVSTFLTYLSQQFLGGAHHNMGLALRDHAALASNPETYGYKLADAPVTPGIAAYEAPSAPRYAESYGASPTPSGSGRMASATPLGSTPGIAPAERDDDAAEYARWRADRDASRGVLATDATPDETEARRQREAKREQNQREAYPDASAPRDPRQTSFPASDPSSF